MTRKRRRSLLAWSLPAIFALSGCLGTQATPATDPPDPSPVAVAMSPEPATSAPSAVPAASPSAAPGTSASPDAAAEAGSSMSPAPGAPSEAPGATAGPPDAAASPRASLAPSTPPTPTPEPAALARDRDPGTLVVMAPEHPTRLLPPATNPTERLLIDLLYDPLYRLDEALRPVPELARQMPSISEDGTTWEIPIRTDARFHDGLPVTPEDVIFSLQLAASPTCPLGTELCTAVRDHLGDVPTKRNNQVIIELDEPYSPFLTEALGRLPILSRDAVKAATDRLIAGADRLNQQRPDNVVTDISEQMLRDACSEAEPPEGCRLVDHLPLLERIFSRASLDLPSRVPFTDETGNFADEAYAGELLDRLSSLGQVFTTSAADKQAAALGLLDATTRPLGGGPYRLEEIAEGGIYRLSANEDHAERPPAIERIEIVVERDPGVAVGQLLSGNADWVLEVGPEQDDLVSEVAGVRAGYRPLNVQRGILFNVRPGRVYFDAAARRAFDLCIDRAELGDETEDDRILATTPYNASSWAMPEASIRPRDVAGANALLDEAGWQMATDGVRIKDGTRLSSTIAVRPSNVDLFTFANEAAEQLSECGIDLVVEELDLTGDAMLTQLLWPNDFDTMLISRSLGPDPDTAVRAFESSRITTEENTADANPSGFTSELADHHIARARASFDQAERAEAYAQVQSLLVDGVPYWPLWYDTAMSAISTRIEGPEGPIDPARPRFDWNVAAWSLRPTS